MIKFFRKIRLGYLSEGKTLKYLKYSIGEIILVVIGILLALQINNWNTDRLNLIEERTVLKNLKKDLLLEQKQIDEHQEGQEIWISSCTEIIKHFNKHQALLVDEKLLQNINNLFVRNGYTPNLNTYSTLENTGKINLLRNEELKENIIEYYLELISFSSNTKNNNETLVDELVNQNLLSLTYFEANGFTQELREYIPTLDNDSPLIIEADYFHNALQAKLNDRDNALLLMNVVNFRRVLALIQVDMIGEVEELTESLLKMVEAELSN